MEIEDSLLVACEDAVVFAGSRCAPKYCTQLSSRLLPDRECYSHIDRSMDPEAMNWPVGSNRAANTSPVWPVNSITGDRRELARPPYAIC